MINSKNIDESNYSDLNNINLCHYINVISYLFLFFIIFPFSGRGFSLFLNIFLIILVCRTIYVKLNYEVKEIEEESKNKTTLEFTEKDVIALIKKNESNNKKLTRKINKLKKELKKTKKFVEHTAKNEVINKENDIENDEVEKNEIQNDEVENELKFVVHFKEDEEYENID